MELVVRPNSARPLQVIESSSQYSGGRLERTINDKAHRYGCGVPTTRDESSEKRFLSCTLIEMERLRIEFRREGFDPCRIDLQAAVSNFWPTDKSSR